MDKTAMIFMVEKSVIYHLLLNNGFLREYVFLY